LGKDPERHYWISFFLETESYLHGNKPLPELSLLIKEQGLTLVRNKEDEDSRHYVVGLSVTAAVLSSKLGFTDLARSHKTEAEALLLQHPELSSSFPGMYEDEQRRYEGIESAVKGKVPSIVGATNPPPRTTISGGIMNDKAKNFVKPKYPSEAGDATGQVTIQVVVDETGKVIWAKPVSGHPLLQKAAEEAAWQTTFKPTILSGKPVKVTGILLYDFVH
jgi:TonB family protein